MEPFRESVKRPQHIHFSQCKNINKAVNGDGWHVADNSTHLLNYFPHRYEVAVQDDADALQQAGIDALALEDVIHIGAVAVQLLCEPTHAALLATQLCLDFFADVYCHFFIALQCLLFSEFN